MVLCNRPTVSIGTDRLACLNSPPGVQLGTLAWHAAGPRFEPRVRRARCGHFFSPPSLPPSGDSFFRTFPTNPTEVLGLLYTTGWVYNNPNTIKSYKILQKLLQNTQHMMLRNQPTLSIGTERPACLNSPPGVQLGTLNWHAAGPRFEPGSGGCAVHAFFLHPPFLPPSGDFFSHLPHQPRKSVRVNTY